jgi:pimeloyl-ACP methyl ester carboxylesterase
VLVRPDGCRLHVEHHGDPSRPALLLLEGMGGDLPGWRRNIPVLAGHCWVMAYDHRGNGRSDEPPGPCTMATFVEDAVAVLDDAGVHEAVWYGQSFGGMVALEAALTFPGRVRGLILAATHAGRDHAIPARTTVPKGEPWRVLYAPGFPEAHPEHVAEDLRAGASQPPHPTGQRRQWEAIEGWSAFDRLRDVRAPTLVLHGSEDLMIDPGSARELAAHIEGAELVLVEGAGHVYHSERPEAADAAVLDFVGRLP